MLLGSYLKANHILTYQSNTKLIIVTMLSSKIKICLVFNKFEHEFSGHIQIRNSKHKTLMAQSKIKKALGAVKDQTSISLAKVGSSTSLADLEVAIVKATRHNEYPAEEKHIREILSLTCYSRAFISACVATLSRRLNKTRSWTVAMKTLILIQRLLYEGDPAYEQEIFFSTRRGTRILNMSDFRDNSKDNAWDFSAFVRTYALYLDERLEYRMQNRRGRRSTFGSDDEDEEHREREKEREKEKEKEAVLRSTPVSDMKVEQLFSRMQHLQLLLERFLAFRPTGLYSQA